MDPELFDIIIIGGGVVGCGVARELSRYNLKTALLEKSADLAAGASRANTGLIHAGFDPQPGTLKARLNVEGNERFDKITADLHVPFKRNGAVVVAFDESDLARLQELKDRGEANGVPGLKLLDKNALRKSVPVISTSASCALHAPTAAIISPYELTFALAENAARNGVVFKCGSEVTVIETGNGSGASHLFSVTTDSGTYKSSIVINAAGLFADRISNMVGLNEYRILPRRGEYLLLDKNSGVELEKTVFPLPSELGKGIVVTPTVSGNILLGPNAEDLEEKTYPGTTAAGLDRVFEGAAKLIPGIRKEKVITSFAGIRTLSSTGDFIIGPTKVEGFIQAAGIQSPGLSAVPAIADLVVHHVMKFYGEESLEMNESFEPERLHPGHPGSQGSNHVICRCEHVTEAKVLNAIKAEVGATTLDGIKLRTRAGMGRCQGGFCTDRVMTILARESGIPIEAINKNENGSWILAGRTKIREKESS